MLTPPERRRVAYHEMGHALVAASLSDVDPVLKVSIIPRGVGAFGYTMQRPTEDRFVLAESELRHRITVLMGGRVAEVLIFDGDVSTGASDDLQRATQIAQEMVTRYGMTQTVGQRIVRQPAAQLPRRQRRGEAQRVGATWSRPVGALSIPYSMCGRRCRRVIFPTIPPEPGVRKSPTS